MDFFKEHLRHSGGHWQRLIVNFRQIYGEEVDIPNILPVLPLNDVIAFPNLVLPLLVARQRSIKAVEYALKQEKLIFLITQREINIEYPSHEDIYSIGTIGRTMQYKETNSKMKVLVQGICRARILDVIQTEPFWIASVEHDITVKTEVNMSDIEQLVLTVKEKLEKIVFKYGKAIPMDIMIVVENLNDPEQLVFLITANLGLESSKAQEILENENPSYKLMSVSKILDEQIISLRDIKAQKK